MPGNYYEKNFNYDLINKTKGEKILIIIDTPDMKNNIYNFNEIKLLKRVSSNSVNDLKRTYYMYIGVIK